MKLKLSILAGALALAVAGQANAAVTASDLILSVWDTNTNTSYTLDTGIAMSTFTAGVTGTASTLAAASPYASGTTTLATSAALASYLSGISSADYAAGDVQWNVVATNGSASRKFNGTQVLTTSNDTNIVGGVSGTILSSSVKASVVTYAGAATNNAVYVSTATNDPAYAGSTVFGANFGTNTNFSNVAAPGSKPFTSSLGFFYLTPASTSTTANALVAQFGAANTAGVDTLNLSSAGTLSYTVAAVPEPSDWLLMLSGFGIVGFMVSRRKNQGSATLA